MSPLSTAKAVRDFFRAHGEPVKTEIDADDKADMSDAYEERAWSLKHWFADGATLTVHWSGYSRGYSEVTPSSPGTISFDATVTS